MVITAFRSFGSEDLIISVCHVTERSNRLTGRSLLILVIIALIYQISQFPTISSPEFLTLRYVWVFGYQKK